MTGLEARYIEIDVAAQERDAAAARMSDVELSLSHDLCKGYRFFRVNRNGMVAFTCHSEGVTTHNKSDMLALRDFCNRYLELMEEVK